jgi:hypothetical protein
MRPFLALFMSFSLALPVAQAAGYAPLCAGQPVEEAHSCCHPQAPACDTGTLSAAYCCPGDVPATPVPAAQAIPPAPAALGALLSPDLPLIEQLAGDQPGKGFVPVPSVAPLPALYQLHRAYRI